MLTLIYSQDPATLTAFKHGHADASHSWDSQPKYTQGTDQRGHWLLIEDRQASGDNNTYDLTADGLKHTDGGVEV